VREPRRCIYCQSSFLPSPRRPQQRVCGQLDCQRRRRADSRRRKLATDPEYGQVVRDSQKKWQEERSSAASGLSLSDPFGMKENPEPIGARRCDPQGQVLPFRARRLRNSDDPA
jgi:hypothetical protein